MNELTLQEYIDCEHMRLLQFEAFWKQGYKDHPQEFLGKMSHGDWNEQHEIFDR